MGRAPEKELMKTGGENVYPAEVETRFASIPTSSPRSSSACRTRNGAKRSRRSACGATAQPLRRRRLRSSSAARSRATRNRSTSRSSTNCRSPQKARSTARRSRPRTGRRSGIVAGAGRCKRRRSLPSPDRSHLPARRHGKVNSRLTNN